MIAIQVPASRSYHVWVAHGLLRQAGELIRGQCPKGARALVVTDSNVGPLYGGLLEESLTAAGFSPRVFTIPAGEGSKSGETYLALLECLARARLGRSDVIVALGGGVTGDLAGFAAATYLRGIPFVQIPTSLLAMVDSSVGGKTAINLAAGKNLAGAFYQPWLVLCDVSLLGTLPEADFADGVAEVVKYGMLQSELLLERLLAQPLREDPMEVIAQCISIKRDVVARDEFDTGERQLLNLGHTLGHAIEGCSNYQISHGRAVATGMAMITRAAVKAGLCSPDCVTRLETLLARYNLPDRCEFTAEALLSFALGDKKRSGDTLTLVIPTGIGNCRLHPIPVEELGQWITWGLEP